MDQTEQQLDEQQLLNEFAEAELTPMQAFWIKVNAEAQRLDPESARRDDEIRRLNPNHKNSFILTSKKLIWLVSKKNPLRRTTAGRIFTATPYLAAQCIVNETHEIATDAQIAKHNHEMARRRTEAAELKAAQNPPLPSPTINVNLSPEDSAAIRDSRKGKTPQAQN